ncbi:formyltetrahydrofolate deformylase [Rhodococcus sp. P1Y]|uniref:formyltetrahydrofolate deformylase n=1 Tax=Rhodococcus sp. P1Y TaxID=1302308 RepID=UPI000EB38323|nr:formyltetrahydrofolate deformylase [Rhodococcus sp. P1Y]AYJ47006.1 formyltetrahydrofolate deformylase [Rhodococcus sp. P1Y]
MSETFTLTLTCPQRSGIVHAVSSYLFEQNCDIAEHKQFDDSYNGAFFLRTSFIASNAQELTSLEASFQPVADKFGMTFNFNGCSAPRIVVMVSKMGHCLNDLIFRWRAGNLGGELVAVVSNHEVLRPMAEAAGLPFVHIPVTAATKPEAESALLDVVAQHDADLVVLARYMQVLSDSTCRALRGRAINIHHSFLPGFKGAKPYHQAFDRGVKQVGATAHYVTPDLDEGPIIEQQVIRIDHSYDPQQLATVGQDAEALALSKAVRWHCENRVLLHGHRTVVFN